MKNVPENLKQLDEKIKSIHAREHSSVEKNASAPYADAARIGFRITVELVSGVVVGAGIGYFIDYLLSTRPTFMIIFLLLGGAAGFLNIYRLVKEEEKKMNCGKE